jgi:protein tyrosine phosphatase (PTP) superfamily phosphohydrolase (DUF442 family)
MRPFLALIALAPLVACTAEAPPEVDDPGVLALGIRNAVLVEPGVVSTGQPTEEQLAALPGLGYRTVIQLRPADEEGTGWEEAMADELGLEFLRIPVAGAEGLTEANARALDAALADAGRTGVVVACASGNRVGGLFALRALYCDGATPEQALEKGKASGLTRAEPAVREVLGLPESQE